MSSTKEQRACWRRGGQVELFGEQPTRERPPYSLLASPVVAVNLLSLLLPSLLPLPLFSLSSLSLSLSFSFSLDPSLAFSPAFSPLRSSCLRRGPVRTCSVGNVATTGRGVLLLRARCSSYISLRQLRSSSVVPCLPKTRRDPRAVAGLPNEEKGTRGERPRVVPFRTPISSRGIFFVDEF